MSSKPVPQALPIRAAMDQSAPLALLARRLEESNARLQVVQQALPLALRDQVRAGPVDEQGWSLLASNAAVAAKLRHMSPLLQQALQLAGCPTVPLRIKIAGAR